MIWEAMSWFSVGPTVEERIAGEKYREISPDQVYPMMQTLFSAEDGIFQDDIAPIHASKLVESLFEVKHLPWLA
ncbi:DDE_3 domain-containing protein [Trichonephila clavipes]|nr:DDE_3 domain-containing protein [Trichonephila clavipes]